jgi:hypothetical protein
MPPIHIVLEISIIISVEMEHKCSSFLYIEHMAQHDQNMPCKISFLFGQLLLCFFIVVAFFLLLMSLNISLFSFINGFNSNWFICVGFINTNLFLSSHTCTKLHIKLSH